MDHKPLAVETVDIAQLHGDPANARRHDAKNRQAIRDSLQSFGQVEPLVVQAKSGRVVAGNGRLEVMRELGWGQAQVVRVDVNDVQAAALGITLNRTGELASWDTQALEELLGGLSTEGWAIEGLGFDQEELSRLLKDEGDMATLAPPPVEADAPGGDAPPPAGPDAPAPAATSHVRMVQLFFNQETAAEFYELADQAQAALGTEHLSDTVLATLRQVAGAPAGAAQAG